MPNENTIFQSKFMDLTSTDEFVSFHKQNFTSANIFRSYYMTLVCHVFNKVLKADMIDEYISRQNIKAYQDQGHLDLAIEVLKDYKEVDVNEGNFLDLSRSLNIKEKTRIFSILERLTRFIGYGVFKEDVMASSIYTKNFDFSYYVNSSVDVWQKELFICKNSNYFENNEFNFYEKSKSEFYSSNIIYNSGVWKNTIFYNKKEQIKSGTRFDFFSNHPGDMLGIRRSDEYEFQHNNQNFLNFIRSLTEIIMFHYWDEKELKFVKIPFKSYKKIMHMVSKFESCSNSKIIYRPLLYIKACIKYLESPEQVDLNTNSDIVKYILEEILNSKSKNFIKSHDISRIWFCQEPYAEIGKMQDQFSELYIDLVKEAYKKMKKSGKIVFSRNNPKSVSEIYQTQHARPSNLSSSSTVKSLSNSCMRYDIPTLEKSLGGDFKFDNHPAEVFGTNDFMIFAEMSCEDHKEGIFNYDTSDKSEFDSLISRKVVRVVDEHSLIRVFAKEHLNPEMSIKDILEKISNHFNVPKMNIKSNCCDKDKEKIVRELLFSDKKFMVCLPTYSTSSVGVNRLEKEVKKYAEENDYAYITDLYSKLFEFCFFKFNPVTRTSNSRKQEISVLEIAFNSRFDYSSKEMFSFPYLDYEAQYVVVSEKDGEFLVIGSSMFTNEQPAKVKKTETIDILDVTKTTKSTFSFSTIFSRYCMSSRFGHRGLFETMSSSSKDISDVKLKDYIFWNVEDFNPEKVLDTDLVFKRYVSQNIIKSLYSKSINILKEYKEDNINLVYIKLHNPNKFRDLSKVYSDDDEKIRQFISFMINSRDRYDNFQDKLDRILHMKNVSFGEIDTFQIAVPEKVLEEAVKKKYIYKYGTGLYVQNMFEIDDYLSTKENKFEEKEHYDFESILNRSNCKKYFLDSPYLKVTKYFTLITRLSKNKDDSFFYIPLSEDMKTFMEGTKYKFLKIRKSKFLYGHHTKRLYNILSLLGYGYCEITKDVYPAGEMRIALNEYNSFSCELYSVPVMVHKSVVEKLSNSDYWNIPFSEGRINSSNRLILISSIPVIVNYHFNESDYIRLRENRNEISEMSTNILCHLYERVHVFEPNEGKKFLNNHLNIVKSILPSDNSLTKLINSLESRNSEEESFNRFMRATTKENN